MSSLSKTTQELKKHDIPYQIVEVWNSHAKVRQDLFHIFDIIALDNGIVGIQVCMTDITAHREKIMVKHATIAKTWLLCRGRIEVWAWRKLKARKKDGKLAKNSIWKPRIIDICLIGGKLHEKEREVKSDDKRRKFNPIVD